MKSKQTRGLMWLAVAFGIYVVVAAMVIAAAHALGQLRDKSFWIGVTGNLMASLIEAFALTAIVSGALYARERKRWGYARNLARARLVNAIAMAWSAIVGPDDHNINRIQVTYHFDSVTTDFGPDFQSLMTGSEIFKRYEIGKSRETRRTYDPEGVASQLTTLSGTLATVIENLENTLALFENQCGPELWSTALQTIEEIKRFRTSLSPRSGPAADVSVQTAVVLDSLAQTGAVITRGVPPESSEAYGKRVFKEAMEGSEKIKKTLARIKK